MLLYTFIEDVPWAPSLYVPVSLNNSLQVAKLLFKYILDVIGKPLDPSEKILRPLVAAPVIFNSETTHVMVLPTKRGKH